MLRGLARGDLNNAGRFGFMKKRFLWILIFLLAFLSAAPFVLIEGIYLYGLWRVRELPSPTHREPLPPLVKAAIWSYYEEKVPIEVKPTTSWDILAFFVREGPSISPGSLLTAHVAARLLSKRDISDSRLIGRLKESSLSIWLSRNWTTDQIMTQAGMSLFINPGIEGLGNAAMKLFGKSIDELKTSEVALILAFAHAGGLEGLVRHPEKLLVRRNRIIEAMFRNRFISEKDMRQAIAQPIKLPGHLRQN